MLRLLAIALLAASCNKTFDAGVTVHDGLPVDERNPVILLNDSADENWMGEYAMLLANSGGPELVGIIVVTGGINEDIGKNAKGWIRMVDAAQKGGLRGIPVPTPSIADKLVRPESGIIEETDISLNYSRGAELIVEKSKSLSQPYRPLVVVAGSRLTDVASAYLKDPSVAKRIWVVASVGVLTSTGASMGIPNGEMDPWASTIVANRLRYIQVSARYDSQIEVPEAWLEDLPRNNSFSDWMYSKQSKIWNTPASSDQVAIAAVGIRGFVTKVDRVLPNMAADASTTAGPPLQYADNENVLLVREISQETATNRFWQMLKDPKVFPTSPDAGAGTR
jgi:hypothetical protein